MFRYQILIEYVGTNFRGWQIQTKGKTIQGLIQERISKLLKEKTILFGAGRLDKGVHALEQSAHFECKKKIENLNKFVKSLNYFLNKEIKKGVISVIGMVKIREFCFFVRNFEPLFTF